jgi:hypothetical protein
MGERSGREMNERLWFGIWFVIWEYWKQRSAYFVSEKEVIIPLSSRSLMHFLTVFLLNPSTVVNVSSERPVTS